MPLFSDREQGPRPTTSEKFSLSCWKGILSIIQVALSNDSFAQSFPDICPDGTSICATSEFDFRAALEGHALPPLREVLPPTYDVLDLLEFCHEKISKVINQHSHPYYSHCHLGFDRAEGQREFRVAINRILERNGLAYKLNENGQIERLAPPVLHEALVVATFKTSDEALNELLNVARRKFLNHRSEVRKEALEKLWDAWERLKTFEGSDKKKSSEALLDKACAEPKLRAMLGEEARCLTKIGNEFMIRHHETDKIPISTTEHVDYLFHRLFALISLLLRSTSHGG